ncbi:universal stress protein [Pseudonocardia hydrocarbonoxydans]|uniref:universal stress protein n=1 Tax=Pseudonocardia hydrocarbonoxydans TaxID=76726 RepID=UPI0031D21045
MDEELSDPRDEQAPGPVVVGVDDTRHGRQAVEWGAAEAVRLGAPLRLVTASGLVGENLPGRKGRDRRLHEVLAGARTAAVAAGAVGVTTALRSGYPADVLADESRAARLVVVGDRGASRLEGVLAGSVAVPLLGRAECPVVVVRGRPLGAGVAAGLPVVVGLDGTPAADAVLEVGLDLAAVRGAELVALHCAAQPVAGSAVDGSAVDGSAVGRSAVDGLVAARAAGRGVPVRVVSGTERPGDLLLAEAQRAQLVVVGSRGRGDLAGLLLGSVSTELVHRAGCPVVVVGPLARRPVPVR